MQYHNANKCNCDNCIKFIQSQDITNIDSIELEEVTKQLSANDLPNTEALYDNLIKYDIKSQFTLIRKMYTALDASLDLENRHEVCRQTGCGDCSLEWCLFNPCPCECCVFEEYRL